MNGISNIQRVTCASTGCFSPAGSDAICSNSWRATALSVSASNRWPIWLGAASAGRLGAAAGWARGPP
ncbi:hypothetical protein OUA97_03075, partial [Phenylobacterium sp. 58.2.17]|nr:hypothetical protein [Phenylobacterium sp. 58.2.17]